MDEEGGSLWFGQEWWFILLVTSLWMLLLGRGVSGRAREQGCSTGYLERASLEKWARDLQEYVSISAPPLLCSQPSGDSGLLEAPEELLSCL